MRRLTLFCRASASQMILTDIVATRKQFSKWTLVICVLTCDVICFIQSWWKNTCRSDIQRRPTQPAIQGVLVKCIPFSLQARCWITSIKGLLNYVKKQVDYMRPVGLMLATPNQWFIPLIFFRTCPKPNSLS